MTLRPLLAYVPWHAREALMRALAPLILLVVMAGLPVWAFLNTTDVPLSDPRAQQVAKQVFVDVAKLIALLSGVLVMARTIAFDRERQYVRVLFAHPVVPWQFYLLRFVVGTLVVAAVFSAVTAAWSVFITPLPVAGAALAFLLSAFLIGALAALCAALVQRDAIPLIFVLAASSLLQQLDKASAIPAWLARVARGLPPVQRLSELRDAWLSGGSVPTEYLPHVLIYGAAMLAAALIVVRRAPLVR